MQHKWVIGDIRGDLGLLLKLMDKIAPGQGDVLIFLGSYLGPAPYSQEVIQYLIDLQRQPGEFLFLRGCYEWMFPQCIETKPSWEMMQLWESMGGRKVFQSYASDKKLVYLTSGGNGNGKAKISCVEIPLRIPSSHLRFLESSLYQWFEDELLPFVACHSGAHPKVLGGEISPETSAFSVKDWWKEDRLQIPGKDIVFSHVPFPKPYEAPGKIGIDLGAGLGGRLCAVEMYTREFTIVR